jgi:hypothetical protein
LFVGSQSLPPIYQASDGFALVSVARKAVQGGSGMALGCYEAAVMQSLEGVGHIALGKLQPVR